MLTRAAALAAAALLAAAGLGAAGDGAVLLSPSDGAIREVLLTVPADDFAGDALDERARAALEGVVRALGPDVHYVVHAWAAHRDALGRTLARAGARAWTLAPSAFGHYTRWAQDLFVVQRRAGRSVWAIAPEVARRLDASVAPEIAAALGRPSRLLPVAVQGGDLVPFGGLVFAGADVAAEEGRRAVERAVAPGQRWVWVGAGGARPGGETWRGRRQPLFHLNMFLAALGPDAGGRERALVASPALGRRLAGQAPRAEDDDRAFDAIAASLAAGGVHVARLPLLLEGDGAATAVITYTNVLQAREPQGAIAWLPRYGRTGGRLAELDRAAARVYEDAGWTVRWVDGPFEALARDWGSLLCMVMVTRRGPAYH